MATSYQNPAVLIDEVLSTTSGTTTVDAALPVVIVGPAYNVVSYDSTSATSLINTAASSEVTSTGTMVAGSTTLTLDTYAAFEVADVMYVAGAGTSGATLQASVVSISGLTFTLSTAAITSVTSALITRSATLTDPSVSNAYNLPSTKSGQVVDLDSIQVYLNNCVVETFNSVFTGVAGQTYLTLFFPTTAAGTTTSGSTTVTITAGAGSFAVGDPISIAGAGTSGAALVTTVSAVTTSTIIVATAAATTVTAAIITKTAISNINSATSTPRIQAGDTVIATYTKTGGGTSTFTSTVTSVPNLTGTVTLINIADILPSDWSATVPNGTVSVRQTYSNQLLAPTFTDGHVNYNTDNVTLDGYVTIEPLPELVYGTVESCTVNIAYTALRTDLSNQLLSFTDVDDVTASLSDLTDANPLALGCVVALANAGTAGCYAMAIESNDLDGYVAALGVLENLTVYAIVPMTQDIDVLTAASVHATDMSTAAQASWRMALGNTAQATTTAVGTYSADYVNANGGSNAISIVAGQYVLTSSNSTFINDGVIAGDTLTITASSGTVGSFTVQTVLSNQTLTLNVAATATGVSFYIARTLTKAAQATAIAANSTAFDNMRFVHVQPDTIGISVNSVTKYLPGYYAAAAIGGLIAGSLPQQGFTNMSVAGIADLKNSNFYYTKANINTIAGAGTLMLVQPTSGGVPYVYHQLTTDMSTTNTKEISLVKNLDYLAYDFQTILSKYIGTYNITTDALATLRTSIDSEAGYQVGQVAPKIGAPLLDYTIGTIAQSTTELDQVTASITLTLAYPMNNILLELIA